MHDDLEPAGETPGRRRPLRLLGRVVAGILVIGSFAIWAYAYSGAADRPTPDRLDDQAFALAAERMCATALDDIADMPSALDAADGPDRADQIRRSTARLETMLDELDALVGGSDRDVEITTGWLADWRVMTADRYRYADAIAGDPNAQFLQTDTGAGERLDRRITRMADTNTMPSCAAPEDVG